MTPLAPDCDMGLEAWLAQTNYPEGRKAQLRTAAERVRGKSTPNVTVKSFVKDEMYTDVKHSRGIFSRNDQFKVIVGPVFKLIEHALFMGPKTSKYFIKKVPAPERAAFVQQRLAGKATQTMATDYTAFESHFVEKLMNACEFQLYDYMTQNLNCPGFKNFSKVIKGMNRIQFRNFTLSVKATRMSGEMNTSLGNSFANLMVFLYLQRNNKNVDCLIEGDDCLGIFDGECPTDDDYKALGLTVKIERPKSVNLASFCGQVFASDLTTLVDPIKFLIKFNWAGGLYKDSNKKTLNELARAKAMSALSSYPACPIVTSFCKYVMRTSGQYWKIDASKSNWEQNRLKQLLREFKLPELEVSEEARLVVAELWGVTIPQQLHLEAVFDSMTTQQHIFDPLLIAKSTPAQREFYWRFVTHIPVGWAAPYFWVFQFDGQTKSVKITQANGQAAQAKAKSPGPAEAPPSG